MMPVHPTAKLLAASALAGLVTAVTLAAQGSTVIVAPASATILVGQQQQFSQTGAVTVADVVAGGWHSCMLMSDRTVRCFGRNNQGQLGNGTLDNASSPAAVAGLNATAIQSGAEHMCAFIGDGTIQCWGTNYTGQLGLGGATGEHGGLPFSLTPNPVQGMANAIALAVGGFFTCAIVTDHTVQCWGRNQDGQLGNGDATIDTSVPGPVVGLGAVSAVSAGGYHVCATLPDNSVKCWGRNDDGQLGTGDWTRATTPVAVKGLKLPPTAISAGGYHTCALLPDGTVQCWGRNVYGQVGQPSTTGAFVTPTSVPGIANAVALKSGFYHTCAILADNTTRCWGMNAYGEIGDGSISDSAAPTQVAGVTGATAVALGADHTCALLSSTAVRCWGEGIYGALGNGGTVNSTTAVAVNGTGLSWTSSDTNVATIDASGRATALVRGTTTITATDSFGNSGSTPLTVKAMLALNVSRVGDGSGTVTSAPAGINCGATCGSTFLSDSQVTLTATPAADSNFVGWAGCDTVSGATCTVTMSNARLVTVTFNLKRFVLTANKAGLGKGTLTSTPGGINCGTDCSEPYVINTTVTLTATADLGSVFVNGWTGCDSVAGTLGEVCTVSMKAARTVTANFVVGPPGP
jgi:alpha-tubulin suppressor-like RCC1 family protein